LSIISSIWGLSYLSCRALPAGWRHCWRFPACSPDKNAVPDIGKTVDYRP
jgi:hypothetical protein